jgi:cell wall-associated NlpC family hydrolase
MEFGIITVPAAPARKKPDHRQEMVNQLLFGEAFEIIENRQKTWYKVKSLYDGYSGWITHHLFTPVNEAGARASNGLFAGDYLNKILLNDVPAFIPMGSFLPGFDGTGGKAGDYKFQFQGEVVNPAESTVPKSDLVESIATRWLNAPYLWGGRTILGVDCSGFAQTVFKLAGVPLPRDAWQQALHGTAVKKLALSQKGDLAFFDDKDEIVHVGIVLSADRIIHASGKVRIDLLDKEGIKNAETGRRTHKLNSIRRFW